MASAIKSHHDLKVWQLGMSLAEEVYLLTAAFPREEMYGLTSQLRRAAASIPANIAEGNGRDSTKEYLRHLSISIGSMCEVETFLNLAHRLRYVDDQAYHPVIEQYDELGRMLRGLQKSLRSKLPN